MPDFVPIRINCTCYCDSYLTKEQVETIKQYAKDHNLSFSKAAIACDEQWIIDLFENREGDYDHSPLEVRFR